MKYIKTVKMATCSEDFYCGDDFDAVLAIFSSYRYDANTTEAVEKISEDENDYQKCSLCVIVCLAISYL